MADVPPLFDRGYTTLGGLFATLYTQELPALLEAGAAGATALRLGFVKAFAALLLVSGIVWIGVAEEQTEARFVLDVAAGLPAFVLVGLLPVVVSLASGLLG